MKGTINRAVTALAFLFLVMLAAAADAQQYSRYCNDRYGFCVDYPGGLEMEPPPVNGDGRGFHDQHGFSMTASGANNAFDDTVKSEMESQTRDFDKITYRARGRNWFVLSGYTGADILYRKTYVGEGASNHLYIKYPARKKNEYDGIVRRISSSFEPGDLSSAH